MSRLIVFALIAGIVCAGAYTVFLDNAAAPADAPDAPGDAVIPVTTPTAGSRVEFPDAGFSLELAESSLKTKKRKVGSNNVVTVQQGKDVVLALNSGFVYPWMDMESMKVRGLPWQPPPVRLEGKEYPFKVDGWCVIQGRKPMLMVVLSDSGRMIMISSPKGDLKTGVAAAMLDSLQPLAGADARSRKQVVAGLTDAQAAGPPPAQLAENLKAKVALLEKGIPKPVPVLKRGMDLLKSGKMTHVDALLFMDVVRPALELMRRQSRPDKGPQADTDPHAKKKL